MEQAKQQGSCPSELPKNVFGPKEIYDLLLYQLNEKCYSSRELHKFTLEFTERGCLVVYYTTTQLIENKGSAAVVGFETLKLMLEHANAFDTDLISAIKTYEPSCECVLFVVTPHPIEKEKTLCRHLIIHRDAATAYWGISSNTIPQVITFRGPLARISSPRACTRKDVACQNGECDVAKALKRCSKCKKAYYCSQACQKKHWKIHVKVCVRAK